MEDDRDGAGISGKWNKASMNDLAGTLNETPGQRVRHSVKSRSYALAEITEIKFEITKSSSSKRNHKLVLKSEISPQNRRFP